MPHFGFGNYHQTEAIPNTLPQTQNSPQTLPQGLFTEQLSGTAFTKLRHQNLHTWLYRKHPSVMHEDFESCSISFVTPLNPIQAPNPLRWSPLLALSKKQSFLEGLFHIASHHFAHLFLYQCNQSMKQVYFSSYDGELLFIPYQGTLTLHTELGIISIKPGQIGVIPRGIFFKVETNTAASGYLCENKGQPFTLPDLGFMGANALANPRHFIYPDAAIEETTGSVELICKYQDHCFQAQSPHSPLNVVAWQGNLAPYTYDLNLFNTLNTVSFDHPDPSIFTVLTSASEFPGIANLDFVIFPPRWSVAEHTFRLPYFHRNIMSELMGLIYGEYEAKSSGFEPGGISIHNSFTPHGPDKQAYKAASTDPLKPDYINNVLAFMLEARSPWQVSQFAMQHSTRQHDYTACWQ